MLQGMTRELKPTDTLRTVFVEGEGQFVFHVRRMKFQIPIEVEYSRLTQGIPITTEFLARMAGAMADLKVLTAESPDGWSLDDMDAWDGDAFDRIMKVWDALRDDEARFRGRAGPTGQGGSQGDSGDVRDGVPAPVQPGADGP